MSAEQPRVVLVGPPGSGKSTIGPMLADRWGVEFRDTDRDIEGTTGLTVSDIFVQQGEEKFRSLERQAVATALAEHRGVLALGGGAVLSEQVRSMLAGQTVVHLDVRLAAAMQRLGMNRSRPLLVGNVRGRWQQLAEQRLPLYAEVATVVVETDGLSPKQVVDTIVKAVDEEVAP